MVRDAGLAYRELDGDRDREILCLVCHEYGRGVAANAVFISNMSLQYVKRVIAKHMATNADSKALTEKERERTRQLRHNRVGLIIARTPLHVVREGNIYLQFDEKLHNLHVADVDIGSLNHSREFIMAFVEIILTVTDLKIERHLHAVDAVTRRKRIFAFMADTVTKLHITWDAVAVIMMSEVGELQAVFCDFLWLRNILGIL
jgi:hypothetical protein